VRYTGYHFDTDTRAVTACSHQENDLRMKKIFLFAFLLLVGCGGMLAQAVTVTSWPDGSVALHGPWRTHSGDDLAYAQAGFDDSQWATVSFADAGDSETGWRWYRLRVELPAEHPPLSLLVIGGEGTYEAYVDGKQLTGPKLKSALRVTYPRERAIALPESGAEIEIALRTYVPPTSMFLADRGAWKVMLGTRTAIEQVQRTSESDRTNLVGPAVVINSLLGAAGLAMLALFWFEKDHREYLWLALYLIVAAVGTVLFELATMSNSIPFSANWWISDPMEYLSTIVLIEFTFSFVGQRMTRAWRMYQGLLLVPTLFLLYPAWHGVISRAAFNVIEVLVVFPAAIGLPILLLVWFHRGNREAGWLIVPTLLSIAAFVFNDLAIASSYFGWTRGSLLLPPLAIGRFSVPMFDVTDLLFLVAMILVMFFRFTRVNRQQARSAAELEAARTVQSLLIPATAPNTPGFQVESIYLPAGEVGGDFFQILPGDDGSLLIVVGDVSGKGLQAAMTVSTIVGALRNESSRQPATVLERLNRVLHGQVNGFVTCAAVLIAADGTMTLANAGNLAPYRNGEEMVVESGLPLGIVSDISYPETRDVLAAGDRITFVSDGVVEATNEKRELFGFERTREISRQPAADIAQTAKTFGQEDDISVLSVIRMARVETARA
jgi:sigma-B regulation protein RsbU (phosphoserine phosphatase)